MKTPLTKVERAAYQCPICGRQVNPESLESADDLRQLPCGHASWFVVGATKGESARVMLLTEFIDVGDTRRQLVAILAATRNPSRLILDLSRLHFLPNSVLKLLVALRGRLNLTGGTLVISGLCLRNYNTLRRAHLTTVLSIRDCPETASTT